MRLLNIMLLSLLLLAACSDDETSEDSVYLDTNYFKNTAYNRRVNLSCDTYGSPMAATLYQHK